MTERAARRTIRLPMARLSASMSWQRRIARGLALLIVMLGAIMMLMPLAWMLSTALKDQWSVWSMPPQWIPNPVVWTNFHEALTFLPFGLFFRNSVYITFACLLGELISASIVAFAFARLRAPGRGLLFAIVLATMMLPRQVTLVPMYVLFARLRWIDTFNPFIVPSLFGAPFHIFLLRQYYMTIPLELDEAAKIDGASRLRVFWQIILPLSTAPLTTVGIYSFMFHWNEFFRPLMYLDSRENLTLPLALNRFRGDYGSTRWDLLMAASLVVLLPCILLFFFTQRYFIQGVVTTGIKG